MVKLTEQLTEIVKDSKALAEGITEDVDRSLSTIDKGLDEAVEATINKLLDNKEYQ